MRGGETNGNMLDSNISKGHGHRSSPSALRSAGASGGARHDTHTRNTQKKRKHTAPPSIVSMGRGAEGARKVTNRLSGCVDTR
jgi:hypothetical protein